MQVLFLLGYSAPAKGCQSQFQCSIPSIKHLFQGFERRCQYMHYPMPLHVILELVPLLKF